MSPEEEKQFKDWLKRAAEDSGAKIADSALFTGIMTESFMRDPLCALQLGYAILMDKPIVLIVDQNVQVPGALVRAAKQIEKVDLKNEADYKRAFKSIMETINNISQEGL